MLRPLSLTHVVPQVVPGLDKANGSVSFQSVNYPTKYLALTGEPEPGRLGVVVPSSDVASFSFDLVASAGG